MKVEVFDPEKSGSHFFSMEVSRMGELKKKLGNVVGRNDGASWQI